MISHIYCPKIYRFRIYKKHFMYADTCISLLHIASFGRFSVWTSWSYHLQLLILWSLIQKAYDGAHQALPNILSFSFKSKRLPAISLGTSWNYEPMKAQIFDCQTTQYGWHNKIEKKSPTGKEFLPPLHLMPSMKWATTEGIQMQHLMSFACNQCSTANRKHLCMTWKFYWARKKLKYGTSNKKLYKKYAFCIQDSNDDYCYLNILS